MTRLFPWHLRDNSVTVNNIPDISLTCFKFPDISRFSRQVVTLYVVIVILIVNDNVYDAVIVALPVREFTGFIWWIQHERRMSANLWTKPISLTTGPPKLAAVVTTFTIAIYYYSAWKLLTDIPALDYYTSMFLAMHNMQLSWCVAQSTSGCSCNYTRHASFVWGDLHILLFTPSLGNLHTNHGFSMPYRLCVRSSYQTNRQTIHM